jgi:hypothetical protein
MGNYFYVEAPKKVYVHPEKRADKRFVISDTDLQSQGTFDASIDKVFPFQIILYLIT